MNENVGQISYLVEIDTKNFTAKLKAVDDAVTGVAKKGGSNFSSFANKASGAFDSVANGIARVAKLAAGVFIGGALGAGTFIKSASALQSLRASFLSLTGSVRDTNKVMSTLYSYGKRTAFKNEDIQQTAKMFLSNGVAVKDLMGWMQKLGDLAGATGADLKMLALPLTQAIGRGKLQTQDWYQIVNQGAGGLQKYIVAALGAGHSTRTFADDMAKGAVTTEVLIKALNLANNKGEMAFKGAIKQAEIFNGRMSNMMEAITNVGLAVLGVDAVTGKVNPGGVFDRLSNAVKDATKWLTDNKDKVVQVANVIIDNFIPGVAALVTAFTVAKGAAIAFGVASAVAAGAVSWPIVAIVAGITAIAGALGFAQAKTNIFGKAWQALVSIAQPAINWFKSNVIPILQKVGDIGLS